MNVWKIARPNTRALLIRLACDGDYRLRRRGEDAVAFGLTIAEALEVLK